MQKIVYLSNSRDYSEQGDINDNKYFQRLNEHLEQGWKVSHISDKTVALVGEGYERRETLVALVVLEKPDDEAGK